MRLAEMLPYQVEQALVEKWPLFVPAGTIEYHGEHLALGTDTIVVIKALEEVERRINCVVAPTIWYGPSSFAVAGPEKGTIHVSEDRFEKYVSDILRGLLDIGFRKIFVVIHHQFEKGQLMPEALAFKKAAVSLIFEYLERQWGRGWWGSERMANYYESLGTSENPFNWIRVIPLMSPKIQEEVGYDHAGVLETSLMMVAAPSSVDFTHLKADGPWFTRSAKEATKEHGEKAFKLIVGYLIKTVSD